MLREAGITSRQKWTPAARRRICTMSCLSGTYQEASELCREWGLAIEDSTVHAMVQELGAKAEQRATQREEQPVPVPAVAVAPATLGVLMIDGCLLRFRGKDWGRSKPSETHVEWHEMKLGVYFNSVGTPGEQPPQRHSLVGKRVVSTLGAADELGRRLNWEARAHGLATARRLRCVSDGAAWIWNLVRQRWSEAEQVLELFHGSEHLYALDHAAAGDDPAMPSQRAQRWRLRLRHGSTDKLVKELQELPEPEGEAGEQVRREKGYFASHQVRLKYRERALSGPIGSGAVESACRSLQCRFKRTGQFWTQDGLRHLCALREARLNQHWDELWTPPSLPQ